MPQYDKADVERRMKGAVESLKGDLSGLRTGRTVHPGLGCPDANIRFVHFEGDMTEPALAPEALGEIKSLIEEGTLQRAA